MCPPANCNKFGLSLQGRVSSSFLIVSRLRVNTSVVFFLSKEYTPSPGCACSARYFQLPQVVCVVSRYLPLSSNRADMQQTKGSTSRTSAVGYGCDKHARPFMYGWKRLARTSGMQQHTEHRSVRSCSKLSVLTRAVLERPPPASFALQRPAVKRSSDAHRQRALLQESLLESAPSQTNTEGRLTTVSLCLVLFILQLVLLVTSVFAICYLLHLIC